MAKPEKWLGSCGAYSVSIHQPSARANKHEIVILFKCVKYGGEDMYVSESCVTLLLEREKERDRVCVCLSCSIEMSGD